jgi:hypothetical protein
MKANTKNTLKLQTTEGVEVTATWPSCGEPVLSEMFDLSINSTSTTRLVRTLFPENPIESIFWGHGEPNYSLWPGHQLNAENLAQLKHWLLTREMPQNYAPIPKETLDFIETAKSLPLPPQGFPKTLAGFVKLLQEYYSHGK